MATDRGNDPALMEARPGAALPSQTNPPAANLAAELARTDAAIGRVAAGLDFYDEPAHFVRIQRRLA